MSEKIVWPKKPLLMSEKPVWPKKPLISDSECILICLKNAPCETSKIQVERLIKDFENK